MSTPLASPASSAALTVPLAMLLPSWPKPVRRVLGGARFATHQVQFPIGQVKTKLRRGRMVFAWSDVKSWIVPPLEGPAETLPGSLKIRVPIELLAEPYREWQRTAALGESSQQPAGRARTALQQDDGSTEWLKKVLEPLPTTAPTRRSGDGVPHGTAAVPTWPNRPLEPGELVAQLRAFPGVEAVLVADKEGRIVTGSMPSTTDHTAVAALVSEIRQRLFDSLRAFDLGDHRRLVVASRERSIVLWSVRDLCVIAVTRMCDTPSVEFFRFIMEPPPTSD